MSWGKYFGVRPQPNFSIGSFLILIISLLLLLPDKALASELQYQFTFSGQSYSTLSAAEAAMKSTYNYPELLEQTKTRFSESTGLIEYTYTVPDRPAFQVGPLVYWGHNTCITPYCYSENEAYDAFKSQQETVAGHCNVVITPINPWGQETAGFGTGLNEGQAWEDGIASIYKYRERNFREDYGLPNSQGACAGAYYADWYNIKEWKPWGCAIPFRNVAVNEPYDTCRVTGTSKITAKITAKPIQFCGPQTPNPIRPLTGEKILAQSDIEMSHISFSRFYHSGTQTFAANSIAPGWQHSYSQYLVLNTSGDLAYAVRENGNFVPLRSVASTLFVSAGGKALQVENISGGYTLTLPSGQKELYDGGGKRLMSVESADGHTVTLNYDTSNRISQITADTGEFIDLDYVQGHQLLSATDHTGRQWLYLYDGLGNLEFVQYPDNTQLQYHYEDSRYPSFVTGITDRRGLRYATYAYDANGRAATSYLGTDSGRVDIGYGVDGTQSVTNLLGVQTQYSGISQLGNTLILDISGPGCSSCGTGNTTYNYDSANNNLLSKIENGLTTDYGNYDSLGQYGYKIESVSTPEQRRTDYAYDPLFFNKVASITEPSVYASDPTAQCTVGTDCKVTTYTYDAYGNRTSETITGFDPVGNPVTRTTTRQYTGPLNQLSQIDGPRSDVADITRYRYYPNDTSVPVGTRARLKEIEDANGVLIRSNIQYTTTGKVSSEQRPNGLSLTYTYYPGNDRLQTLTETDTRSGTARVTRWTYLATGEVQSITTGDGTPDATTLTFGYDDARRLTRITDGLGNHIDYTLDTEGNRLAEITYDANGTPSDTADDVIRRQLTQTFDIYNRLDTTAQANETTNPDFAPDGTLDRQADGNGVVTDFSYDALKRLTQTTQDLGGTDPATAGASTAYGYDAGDRLTSVTDPVNGNTTYGYDDLGNLVSQTSPDTGTTTFRYDTAGNLIEKTAAAGTPDERIFTYTYDALNRLINLDAPGTADDITYGYDTCPGGTGRLCTVTYGDPAASFPASNTVHYQYNAFGDITFHQGSGYSYDAAGRLKIHTYPSGATLTYTYDAAGQISQLDLNVNGATETLATNIAYAPFGPLTNLSYGNGLTLIQSYDTAYRLSDQTLPGVLERSYLNRYDANGNRTGHTDALATPTLSSFSYDALNRLDTGTGPFGARDYDYDKNGNRTRLDSDSTITAYAYTPNSNRLDTLGSNNVTLDAHGNTTGNGLWSYSYNPHNRLIDATESATLKAVFAYNGLGQRIRKTNTTTAGNSRHFLYGLNGELLAETDDQGNVLWETVYLNGQPLARYSPDDDGDGLPNAVEARAGTLPQAPDSDGDTLTNLEEWFSYGTDSNNVDSDGDGINDNVEIAAHTDPNNAASVVGDGDVNHDGQVNLGDLVLLYQYVLGTRAITPDALSHGDMNRDGQLNTPDILLLQQQLLTSWLEWGQMENGLLAWLIPTSQAALPANGGVLYYVHNDPLGTPQALTDESGTVVWKADYDPFGKATVNEDPDGDGNTVTLNVRFPGQYYDQETGLHYNYQRYYDPATGRYLTSDPLGLQAGANTFLYGDANPITNIDPLGLIACSCKVENPTAQQYLPYPHKWCTYSCTCDCPKAGGKDTRDVFGPGTVGPFGSICLGQRDILNEDPNIRLLKGAEFDAFGIDTEDPSLKWPESGLGSQIDKEFSDCEGCQQ